MRVDGKRIAEDIYADLAPRFANVERNAVLGIVVVGENPVIASFVRIKERSAERLGIPMIRENLPESATEKEIIDAVDILNKNADAVIVQLPLPSGINTKRVLSGGPKDGGVGGPNPAVPESQAFWARPGGARCG